MVRISVRIRIHALIIVKHRHRHRHEQITWIANKRMWRVIRIWACSASYSRWTHRSTNIYRIAYMPTLCKKCASHWAWLSMVGSRSRRWITMMWYCTWCSTTMKHRNPMRGGWPMLSTYTLEGMSSSRSSTALVCAKWNSSASNKSSWPTTKHIS